MKSFRFLMNVCLLISCLCFGLSGCSAHAAMADEAGWQMVPGILEQIQPPTFPDQDFDVTRYGADGDGDTDCTQAFAQAIDECHNAGGGRVVVPEGVFLTGAIHLKSNVNLHLKEGSCHQFFYQYG